MDDHFHEIKRRIKSQWEQHVSVRSFLYYAYLLTQRARQEGRTSIKDQLRKMATYQADGVFEWNGKHFVKATHKLYERGWLEDEESCFLTPELMRVMAVIFREYIGEKDGYVPYNGVEICEAADGQIANLWISPLEKDIREVFGTIEGCSIYSLNPQDGEGGRAFAIEADLAYPTLVLYVPNVVSLEDQMQMRVVDTLCLEVIDERESRHPQHHNRAVGMICAPRYSYHVSKDAVEGFKKRHLMGPINFSILIRYLKTTQTNRAAQLNGLLSYLLPPQTGLLGLFRGHRAGIFDAHNAIDYIIDSIEEHSRG